MLPMIHYLFKLSPHSSISKARKSLHRSGLMEIYLIEDKEDGSRLIGGFSEKPLSLKEELPLTLIEETSSIDWTQQAKTFSPCYSEGVLKIDLTPYGVKRAAELLPGEAFGDLSHPTTELMLQLMKDQVNGKVVLDIGSGSGILTIISAMLEAKAAYGVEIDQTALEHSHKNLSLNNLQHVYFYSPEAVPLITPDLILCNMISSEQEVAYTYYPHFQNVTTIITSGVLKTEQEAYLSSCKQKGWNVVHWAEKEGWMGFIFER